MVVGDANGIEVVAGPLDLGPLEDAEAHLGEGFDAVVHGLGDGVEAAQRLRPPRQGNVEGGVGRQGRKGVGPRRLAARFQLALECRLELVEGLSEGGSLLGRSVLQATQAEREATILAAEPIGAPRLALGLAISPSERFQRFRTKRVNLRFCRGHRQEE